MTGWGKGGRRLEKAGSKYQVDSYLMNVNDANRDGAKDAERKDSNQCQVGEGVSRALLLLPRGATAVRAVESI